jgi:uncharacterized iron-regulated membrane protein
MASISDAANPGIPAIEQLDIDSVAFAQLQYTIDFERVVQAAQRAIPNLVVKDILLPSNRSAPIYLTGTSDEPLVRNRANRVYIHPTTYEVVGLQNANNISTITWLNDIADPLHFGNFGGLLTKVIWFFSGLAITFLVGTGIWISLKRKIKDVTKGRAKQLGKWKYLNALVVVLMFGFMFYILFSSYAVNTWQIAIIIVSWLVLFILGWLVYVKRLNKGKISLKK